MPSDEEKNSFMKTFIMFLLLILVGLGIYWSWYEFSEEGQERQKLQEFARLNDEYFEEMRNDTYGGETPEETLNLFIEALRNEDIELASEYFLADQLTNKSEWKQRLEEVRAGGNLDGLINDLESAVSNPEDSTTQDDFKFVLLDDLGLAKATLTMFFNSHSGVWKIESL